MEEILDLYDRGLIIAENTARKCYLSELQRHQGKITWIHDDELKGHSLLHKMGKQQTRDLMRELRQH